MVVEYRKRGRSVAAGGRNSELRSKLEQACSKRNGFVAAWAQLGEDSPMLRWFSGDITTPSQGSATVKSEFSTLKNEKDSYRGNLAHLSVESTLHAKQCKEVRTLREYVLDD